MSLLFAIKYCSKEINYFEEIKLYIVQIIQLFYFSYSIWVVREYFNCSYENNVNKTIPKTIKGIYFIYWHSLCCIEIIHL